MRKQLIFTLLIYCLFFLGCSKKNEPVAEQKLSPASPRPGMNILLITVDTLRADYLSCYGGKKVATPNVDALAARGVRCAQAIAQVPLTAPSHASILTGTYPQLHKVRDMGGFVLDNKIPTLATILGEAGFDTAAFVGAAVLSHHYGMNRGFALYRDEMRDEASTDKLPGVVAEVRGEVVTRRALEFLEKSVPAKPFFLWAHYYDPHFPYDPPEPYRTRYAKELYGGEVAYADEEVGKLLRVLGERHIEDKTLVVLLGDHGESLGEHGEYTHGVFLYDSTMRVPMIFAGPGVPAGRVIAEQVRSIDVLPTIMDYLGLVPGAPVQGVSLKPAIVEGKSPRSNYCYMETLYPKTQMGWSELRGMRTDEFKLIVAPKPELYRYSDDKNEAHNLADKLPADADRLQKKVWEVAGPPQSLGMLQPQLIDEERQRELNALGYVSAGRRTIQIDMSGPDPKDRVAVLEVLERTSDAINHNRWKEAVTPLEKISQEDPSNPLIYRNLTLCYERLRQFDMMERTCRRAVDHKAESDETFAKWGEIFIRRGDLARAVDLMEKASKMNPANLKNMDNLATAYLQLGRQEDTERVLRATLAQNPSHATAHNVFGNLEIQRGRVLEARKHFEQAIEYDRDLAEPYVNLGLIAQNAGNSQAAISYYRSFLKKADKDKHRDYIPKVKAALADLGATP
jgi:choline-sulfatase